MLKITTLAKNMRCLVSKASRLDAPCLCQLSLRRLVLYTCLNHSLYFMFLPPPPSRKAFLGFTWLDPPLLGPTMLSVTLAVIPHCGGPQLARTSSVNQQ